MDILKLRTAKAIVTKNKFWRYNLNFKQYLPINIIIILNCYRAMRDAQLKRDKLFKENRKNECKRLRDSNCTTLMLIVVVTVFLMTEIPLAVVTVSNF